MPRPNRFLVMERAKPQMVAVLQEQRPRVFSEGQLVQLLNQEREGWGLSKVTTWKDFVGFLVEQKILNSVEIKTSPRKQIHRYSVGKPSVYEIALSLRHGSYLTHFSALHINNLTDEVPKTIYTNREQTSSGRHDFEDALEQKRIDFAFARPMRQSNSSMEFSYDNISYRIINLNGRNTGRLGVTSLDSDGAVIHVTNLERTLIDATVRPDYCGGVQTVFQAYQNAKMKLSIPRLVGYLKNLNYKYPYHQSIGFYLEKAGYDEKSLQHIKAFEIKNKFYLTYRIPKKEFSERWSIFYPQDLFS